MTLTKFIAAGAVLGVANAADAAKPTYPTEYTAELTFEIPYYGTVEQVVVANSDSQSLQRTSYYDDRNVFITDYSSDDAVSYELTPAHNEATCFTEAQYPVVVFPDLTDFELQDEQTTINGELCNEWSLTQEDVDDYGYIGQYSLYVSAETNAPVQFHQLGHNVVLGGSHYDEYVLTYNTVTEGTPDPSLFTVDDPSSCVDLVTDDNGPTEGDVEHSRHNLHLFGPHAAEIKSDLFKAFLKKHEKTYAEDEMPLRYALFHNALHYINAHNHQGNKYTVGLNHLADWTREERRALNGHKPSSDDPVAPAVYDEHRTDLPTDFDWREKGAVVPVGDQGTCGSCWAWGTVGAISGAEFVTNGELPVLSAQQLMDCSWDFGSDGCMGSTASKALEYLLQANDGVSDTVESYPYENQNGYCRDGAGTKGSTVKSYVNVTSHDFDAFNSALVSIAPLSIAINANPDSFYFYSGGIYDSSECVGFDFLLDHEVLAVGYGTSDDGELYTIVQNSWSTHWGEDGYVKIAQTGNVCGVSDEPVGVYVN